MKLVALLWLCGSVFGQTIPNFGMVSHGFYRGAQPDGEGLLSLSRLGVKTVISLRDDSTVERERVVVESLGMTFVNVPMRGIGATNYEDVIDALWEIGNAKAPIFLHCKHGRDRTGVIVACWRIQRERWSNDRAMQEAEFYGINWLQFAMKRYIMRYRK